MSRIRESRVRLITAAAILLFALSPFAEGIVGDVGHPLVLPLLIAIGAAAYGHGRRGAWLAAAAGALAFTAGDVAATAVHAGAGHLVPDLEVAGAAAVALGLVVGEIGGALHRERRLHADLDGRGRENALLAAALRRLHEGVVLVDPDGAVRFANPAAATLVGAVDPGALAGRRWREIFPGFAGREVTAAPAGALHDATLRRPDGAEIYVHLAATPVSLEGAFAGTVVVMSDQTERRRLARRAAAADRLATVGRLAAGVAHEINNPLASILTNAELLLANPLVPADTITEGLDTIAQETRRAARIVKDLIAFARRPPAARGRLDLAALAREAAELRRAAFAADNIVIAVDAPAPVPVDGDGIQLLQVLVNLISNAEHAVRGAAGARIDVRVERAEGHARLVVDDSGPGVPEEMRERVFDPFFTTKAEGQGTGLGLSVAYGIVQEHDGRVWVEASPSGGARFVVRLPLADRPA